MKKLFVIFALLFVFASGSWAFDNAYHVKQAPNAKGDLLIFPMYFTTADGWQTKLTVTNTSDRYSVIAKVVYRSHYWSDELLDHLIYLSPRDVWTGYVRTIAGQVSIYSEDDSILRSNSQFASPSNPITQPFFTAQLCTDNDWNPDDPAGGADSVERGYVEVIETWYGDTRNYPDIVVDGVTLDRTPPKVDKQYLRRIYNVNTGPGGNVAGIVGAVNSDGVDNTINVLTGVLELSNAVAPNFYGTLRATVFADFDVTQYMTITEASGLNAFTGQNTLGELEAALAKDDIAMQYMNNLDNGMGTIHMFNFPTKKAWNILDGECDYLPKGPFWKARIDDINATTGKIDYNQCLAYSAPLFDLTEEDREDGGLFSGGAVVTSEMCEELQWVFAVGGNYFTEGWQEYRFNNIQPLAANQFTDIPPTSPRTQFEPRFISPDFNGTPDGDNDEWTYTGVPVIPVILNLNGSGMSLSYGAYTDGEVYASDTAPPAGGSWLPDYHYWNYMDALGLNNTAGNNNNGIAADGWYPQAATFPIDTFPAIQQRP